MDIKLGEGLGSIKFGMSPKEVKSIMGDEQVYEPWMGGNLNDALLYKGIIIYFDVCDSKGPLANSKVNEFEIDKSFSNVQFMGRNVFQISSQQLEQLLIDQKIPYKTHEHSISANTFGVEFDTSGEGEIVYISFWKSGASTSIDTNPDGMPQTRSLDNLINYLKTSSLGWPQYFQRLEVVTQLGIMGDPNAIPVLEEVTQKDTQEFDAWGLGAGFSMAYFAQEAIDKIKAKNQMNPNIDVVAFFVRFFKDVPYQTGVIKAEFSRYEDPSWEADWKRAKQIIKGRRLSAGEPLKLVVEHAGKKLKVVSDDEAYRWLDKMIIDVERHDK